MLPSSSLAVRIANYTMSRWANPDAIAGQTAAWEYNHGIVLRGIEGVWRHTNDARYLTYIQKYVDGYVGANGSVPIPASGMHSFDNMQPSIFLPLLYQQTNMAKYKTAADSVHAYYATIPTNPEGGFWHKQMYPNQMWLDSIYMGEPFLMRYATAIGTCGTSCSDTVSKQMLLIAQHVRDTNTGLLYHAWDDSPAGMKTTWANATTGRSPSVWGRALGWYAMALVDVLPDLPAGSQHDQLLAIFQGLVPGRRPGQHDQRLAGIVGQRHVRLRAEGRRQSRLPRRELPDRREQRLERHDGEGDERFGQHAQHHRRREGDGRAGQLRRLRRDDTDAAAHGLAARPVRHPARRQRDGSAVSASRRRAG
jgi:rhamnogalacturonyl hydrolase YesR